MRWLLVAAFLVYWNAGGLRYSNGAGFALVAFMFVAMGAAEILFARCHRDREAMFRVWAIVLPVDIIVLMSAAAADKADFSPIPLVALATIFSASAMFRPPYLLGLTVFAALAAAAAFVVASLGSGDAHVISHVLVLIVIPGIGGFAVTRGQSEEALRRSLIDSQAREREQSDALRSALDSARMSEARFHALLENAPAIILVWDRLTRSVISSRYVHATFGSPGIGFSDVQAWAERITDDTERLSTAIAGAMAGTGSTVEFSGVDLGGARRHLSGVIFPIEDGVAIIARDVTEERDLAAQVARAQQMETLGTLAGGIAHDFNNLLTAILGNLYLLRLDFPEDSRALPMLDDAQRAGERGAELVRRLLAYGRPSVDQTESIDLARLIEETASLAEPGLTPRIELVITPLPPGTLVDGSFSALQQVLLNLLVNGRDAMPGGGRLTVSCSAVTLNGDNPWPRVELPAGDYHLLTVSDTGTGIPADLLGRIFDPFVTSKEVGKGTGLGLSTALSIARAHGGWLDVETREGHGSTFRMLLPALAAAAQAERDVA
jgi:signal transduction histidine kinase